MGRRILRLDYILKTHGQLTGGLLIYSWNRVDNLPLNYGWGTRSNFATLSVCHYPYNSNQFTPWTC